MHRDIPYIHTPTKYPLSLSFLTFLSSYENNQLRIWPGSHANEFYEWKGNKGIDMRFKRGDTLVFDSNLIHRTLDTTTRVDYVLHMFSSPIIKPVVDYSSDSTLKEISSETYLKNEILEIIGLKYKTASDDYEYLTKHG